MKNTRNSFGENNKIKLCDKMIISAEFLWDIVNYIVICFTAPRRPIGTLLL